MGSIGWQDLTRHVYCIARSGHGKSAILRNLVHQLMASQDRYPSAVIYIDPKGDDAIKMLLEADDLSKVTFLDPVRAPFSINPLELPPHSKEDEERIRSMYTGFMMRLIQEWYSIDKVSEAPRMLRIIERVIDALYFLHGAPTFLDLHHVITTFQKGDEGEVAYILSQFSDVMQNVEELKRALHSIAQMKGEAFDPVLTRLERFATDPYLKRLFCARHSTVDLAKSLEPGHLTIVRVPAHEVGSHIAPFVMGTVVIKLWFCVLERASRIEEEKRTPVILALDEFQELKGLGVLEQMLAQARAFKLGLWLSHQNLQQIDDKMLATVLGNAGTQIAGRVNGADASRLARNWEREQFRQAIEEELITLPDYTFLVRELPGPGEEQMPPRRVKTLPPPKPKRTMEDLKEFLEAQKARYGIVEKSLFDIRKDEWVKYSAVIPIPSKEEWLVLCALEKGPANTTKLCELTGLPRDANTSKLIEDLHNRDYIKVFRSDRAGSKTWALSKSGTMVMPPNTKEGFAEVGGEEAQEIALKAREHYLSHHNFFALARQDLSLSRKVDCIAYDYDSNVPIGVEIESPNHVKTHPEELKAHMLEIEPFKELHVWILSESKEKVSELLAQLPEDQRAKIRVFETGVHGQVVKEFVNY